MRKKGFYLVILIIGCCIVWMINMTYKNHIKEKIFNIFELNSEIKIMRIKNGLIINETSKKRILKKEFSPGFSDGYFHIVDNENMIYEFSVNGICFSKTSINEKEKIYFGTCSKTTKVFKKTGTAQIFVAPKDGFYKIELWGAAGGKSSIFLNADKVLTDMIDDAYGKGAYTSGEIYLSSGNIIYVYVGGKGEDARIVKDEKRMTGFGYPAEGGMGGYNGGGDGYDDPECTAGGGGGGATDVRLKFGKSDDLESLKSRIMVSGGGGGMSRFYLANGGYYYQTGTSGSGGTINGKDGKIKIENSEKYGYGSKQDSGYKLGIGENGNFCMSTINGLGGGAGGYYGSRAAFCNPRDWVPSTGAGGGSSYVSGCKKCNSVSEIYTFDKPIHTGESIHFSNKKFKNIIMISGDDKMPNPKKSGNMNGNNDDGIAKISYIGGGY